MDSRRRVGRLVFVGLMFLGAGVGLLVGNVIAWGSIGMGLGFIAMALLRLGDEEKSAEATPCPPSLPTGGRFGAVPLLGLGVIFTATGVVLLLGLAVPWKTVSALFLVLMGLGFLWWGASLLRTRQS